MDVLISGLVVWARSKVYQHPSTYLKDNIFGWLCLIREENGDLALVWSEQSDILHAGLEEPLKAIELSAIGASDARDEKVSLKWHLKASSSFRIPIKSLYSITLRIPTLASWYGSVKLRSRNDDSEHSRMLFFHDEEVGASEAKTAEIVSV